MSDIEKDLSVGDVEETLDSGDYYELYSPCDGTNIMNLFTQSNDHTSGQTLSFTREELTSFINQCQVYLTNP